MFFPTLYKGIKIKVRTIIPPPRITTDNTVVHIHGDVILVNTSHILIQYFRKYQESSCLWGGWTRDNFFPLHYISLCFAHFKIMSMRWLQTTREESKKLKRPREEPWVKREVM